MTGGGGRRAQRWPEIWPDHRADLLHAAHGVWQACIPAMRSLSTDGTDYRAVDRLQAAALAFSSEISEGVSWLHSSATPAGLLPAITEGREAEVDEILATCGEYSRIAIRTLLDIVERMGDDRE